MIATYIPGFINTRNQWRGRRCSGRASDSARRDKDGSRASDGAILRLKNACSSSTLCLTLAYCLSPPPPSPYPNSRLVLSLSSLRLLLSSLFSLHHPRDPLSLALHHLAPSQLAFLPAAACNKPIAFSAREKGSPGGACHGRHCWWNVGVDSIDKLTPTHGLYGWYQATDL